MKQKKCPQCKNLISVTAPTCLYCGRPNKFVTSNYVKRKWDKEYNKDNKNKLFKITTSRKLIFIFIIFIIFLLVSLYKQNVF